MPDAKHSPARQTLYTRHAGRRGVIFGEGRPLASGATGKRPALWQSGGQERLVVLGLEDGTTVNCSDTIVAWRGDREASAHQVRGAIRMSLENLAIVRAIYEALLRGESPATLDLLHPDIEYVNPSGAVEPGTRRGIAAYEDALRSMHEVLADVRIEVREIIDAGDQVVVLATFTARGRSSGAQRHNEDGYVWTVRDGKAVSFQWFHHAADALKAAGLE